MEPLCHLNGRVLPLEGARIDPRDRGLLFGDALYEVVRVERGRSLHLEPHLRRLREGLERVRILSPPDLEERCLELIRRCRLEEGSLFLEVTRGAGPRTRMPPRRMEPTLLILPQEHSAPRHGEEPLSGVTVADPRWLHCDLKTTSMMATVLGKLEARDAKAEEVIFVGDGGELREGGSTNLFVRRGERLETHPLDGRILPGVTRAQVLALAAEEGLEVVEKAPRLEQREEWREAFLCGTLTTIQGLVALDGEPVGDGEPGPWTQSLAAALARSEAGLLEVGAP